ncbi:hypothetical protein GIB67_016310 [Kingdonia uniflora]|uniref:Uncharacterized protein n=1 Tax=Kingdonia uniflora TaxID=39325 RepID=A0A7J7M9S2_9MAGN|nr:hypothetical protein GIB67_016310 [Kingdonia uniflora]
MDVLWRILDIEQPDTQTINKIVVPSVELIYSYAECLVLHQNSTGSRHSVAPATVLLKKLLFSLYEVVQTSTSLVISSRLLQVPYPQQTMLGTDDAVENIALTRPPTVSSDIASTTGRTQVLIEDDFATSSVEYYCDGRSTVPILRYRWHCTVCLNDLFSGTKNGTLQLVITKLEIFPGSKFRVAYEEAVKYGSKITLRRTWGKLSMWHKVKFLKSMLFEGLSSPSLEEISKMMKEMSDVDMISFVIQEMGKAFPTLIVTLLYERDMLVFFYSLLSCTDLIF